ncbi:TPA: prepilin peptidase [Citrobacter sedlakii]|nr:prepilin peptidase [Citrobacter sedlakii]HCA7137688.1 prepilin peptidase [Citrobacter sedlakii]HCA7183822.1 prepilin peptidase [Citrobacter sedlakii]
MNEADDEIGHFPFLSLLVISVASLIYYLSSDFKLFIFCCCLAIVAYIDACKRWIPDQMIYLLIAISVYSLGSRDLTMSLIAVSFYITPVALLSVYGYLVKRESWIASGDYYVFPSIGLMLTPDYAAGVMLTTLFAMLILTRWVRKIPLITVAYFTFTGFKVCSILGIL